MPTGIGPSSGSNWKPRSVTRPSRLGQRPSLRLTRVCPSGTYGLVYRARPIKEVDKYKDSKIDLETKKEDSNPYSTRILVNSCSVAYIKPGKGAPRGTSYNLQYHRQAISRLDKID
jgi:hypothetical protein